jgi:N-acyl-L-homoserine lactone synthetase
LIVVLAASYRYWLRHTVISNSLAFISNTTSFLSVILLSLDEEAMIRIVTKDIAEGCYNNPYQVHRLRKAVLKDQLGYGTVNGSARRLPATGPNRFRDVFPSFATRAAVPRGERAREAGRIAVSATPSGLKQAYHKRPATC